MASLQILEQLAQPRILLGKGYRQTIGPAIAGCAEHGHGFYPDYPDDAKDTVQAQPGLRVASAVSATLRIGADFDFRTFGTAIPPAWGNGSPRTPILFYSGFLKSKSDHWRLKTNQRLVSPEKVKECSPSRDSYYLSKVFC